LQLAVGQPPRKIVRAIYAPGYEWILHEALCSQLGALVVATGNTVASSPAVVGGVVYVGSADNSVYALNASTGAKLWSFDTGNAVGSSPAVVNDTIYVGFHDHTVSAFWPSF